MAAGPPGNLALLADLKLELSIPTLDTSKDAYLSALISEASDYFVTSTNRTFFYEKNHVEHLSAFASTVLQVRDRTPIDVLTVPTPTITILFDSAVYDPNVYFVKNARIGTIYNRTGWYWTAPLLPNIKQTPYSGQENPLYTVTYSGGYVTPQQALDNPLDPILSVVTLPGDLTRACVILCTWFYRMRGQNYLLAGERLMSYSYSYHNYMMIPFVDSVIQKYRKWGMSS